MITIDLSKQPAVEADLSAIKQNNLIANLESSEEQKKFLDFSQGTAVS